MNTKFLIFFLMVFQLGAFVLYANPKTCFLKMELNNNWQFKDAGENIWLPAQVPGTVHTDLLANGKIEAPFFRTNEKELQWIDKKDWEYRTSFEVSAELLNKDFVELDFEGLDTYADVFLNGQKLFSADNMFREWKRDVKEYLKAGQNELHIYFHSPVKIDQPKLKALGYSLPATNDQSENGGLGDKKISVFARKAPYHYGWDWGPRFVTSGIWRPVKLQAWNTARIKNIHYIQHKIQSAQAKVVARFEVEVFKSGEFIFSVSDTAYKVISSKTVTLSTGNQVVPVEIIIDNPKLWWPNGMGQAFLYHFTAQINSQGKMLDESEADVGLRTIRLVREKDAKGTSFYFEVNGKPVFAKGANYIPNDNFLPRVSKEKYEQIIQSAVDANMNMLRVWGGGIYENDIFYQLCDRNGIMVWQDFMFACSMYPGDDYFLENVWQEAVQNVQRLRNHPCIVLWCGNNEIDAAWSQDTPGGWGWKERYEENTRQEIWQAYDTLFHKILPEVVEQNDPERSYWPSSPLADWHKRASYNSSSGDVHYWGVWHGKERFDSFRKYIPRFMSEYGFQSFPEFDTVRDYTIAEDWNINSEVMAAHQRSGIGNKRIEMYMGWYYRLPKRFEDQLYMSQVLQAEAIKFGIETHRRNKPYCMGTLYWQINDCWPVASWSGIDYFGRWKALHYFTKKAFNNVLVSSIIDEDKLKVYITSDVHEKIKARLDLVLMNFQGDELKRKSMDVVLAENSSKIFYSLEVNSFLNGHSRKNTVLYLKLSAKEKLLSENVLYFDEIKDLDLPIVKPQIQLHKEGDVYRIELYSGQLAKNVYLDAPGSAGKLSDNYFDLMPGQKKTVYLSDFKADMDLKPDEILVKTVRDTY